MDLDFDNIRRLVGVGFSLERWRWEDGFGNPITWPDMDMAIEGWDLMDQDVTTVAVIDVDELPPPP